MAKLKVPPPTLPPLWPVTSATTSSPFPRVVVGQVVKFRRLTMEQAKQLELQLLIVGGRTVGCNEDMVKVFGLHCIVERVINDCIFTVVGLPWSWNVVWIEPGLVSDDLDDSDEISELTLTNRQAPVLLESVLLPLINSGVGEDAALIDAALNAHIETIFNVMFSEQTKKV